MVGGCATVTPPGPAPGASPEAQFAQLERAYMLFFLARNPVPATYLGGAALDASLAQIDGKLRDHSPAALAAEDRELVTFRERFAALDPAALPEPRRIDRGVVLAQIDFHLHLHQARKYPQRALDTYVDEPFRGIDWQLQGMTPTGPGRYGTGEEWARVIERARAVRAFLRIAQEQLRAGIAARNTPDWRMIRVNGVQSAEANTVYFESTLPELARARLGDTAGPRLDEIRAAGADAAAAYRELRDFLVREFVADPARNDDGYVKEPFRGDRYMMGAVEYDWALRNNLRLETTAAALFVEAWPVVERTRAQMIQLARAVGAKRGLKLPADGTGAVRAVMDRLDRDAPKSDAQMLEWYRDAGARLVAYGRKTQLFDPPQEYVLEVVETPPPLRASLDGAAYYPAPPFKGTGGGRFYVTTAGNDPAKLAEHNRWAVADLAAHEGFPGHDWHYRVMAQHRDRISLVRWLTPGAVEDSSSMWQDSLAAEGWALYAEALMAEPQPGEPQGFYTPEERLYQLRGQLYRDLRVRIDTGLHTGRMSFDEAVDLFSQVVDFLPGSCGADAPARANPAKRASCDSAWRAIYRYSKWPTQAITYRLGKDAILALRAEAQRQLGSRFSAQRFHVEYMKQGTIPSGYFRTALLETLRR